MTAGETDTWPEIKDRVVSQVLYEAILNFQRKNRGRGLLVDGHIDPGGTAITLLASLAGQTAPPQPITLPVSVPGFKVLVGYVGG